MSELERLQQLLGELDDQETLFASCLARHTTEKGRLEAVLSLYQLLEAYDWVSPDIQEEARSLRRDLYAYAHFIASRRNPWEAAYKELDDQDTVKRKRAINKYDRWCKRPFILQLATLHRHATFPIYLAYLDQKWEKQAKALSTPESFQISLDQKAARKVMEALELA